MILLHRLAHTREPFHLNPDLISVVEETPDCHVTLTTGTRYVVLETADEVVEAVRAWRVGILADALARTPR
jgi:flagellar protein FlbD